MYCIVTKGRDGKHLRDKLGQKDGELKRLQEKLSLCCDSPSQFLTPGSQHRHGGTHDWLVRRVPLGRPPASLYGNNGQVRRLWGEREAYYRHLTVHQKHPDGETDQESGREQKVNVSPTTAKHVVRYKQGGKKMFFVLFLGSRRHQVGCQSVMYIIGLSSPSDHHPVLSQEKHLLLLQVGWVILMYYFSINFLVQTALHHPMCQRNKWLTSCETTAASEGYTFVLNKEIEDFTEKIDDLDNKNDPIESSLKFTLDELLLLRLIKFLTLRPETFISLLQTVEKCRAIISILLLKTV